jgi:hypothetical protein
MHAWEQEGITPDLQIIANGLGGGYQPIGGILIGGRIVDALRMTYRGIDQTNATLYRWHVADDDGFPANFATQAVRWAASAGSIETNAGQVYQAIGSGNADPGYDDARYYGSRTVTSNALEVTGIPATLAHSAAVLTRGWLGYGYFSAGATNYLSDIDGLWTNVTGVGTNRTVPVWTHFKGSEGTWQHSGYHLSAVLPEAAVASRHEPNLRALYNAFPGANPCEANIRTNALTQYGMTYSTLWGDDPLTYGYAHWLLRWDASTNGFQYVSH